MLIEIEHELRFEYDAFIHESFMELRVEPLTDPGQSLRSFYLAVGPPTHVARYSDWNGNLVHHFGVTDYHDRIEVLVRSAIDTHPRAVDDDPLLTRAAGRREASGGELARRRAGAGVGRTWLLYVPLLCLAKSRVHASPPSASQFASCARCHVSAHSVLFSPACARSSVELYTPFVVSITTSPSALA